MYWRPAVVNERACKYSKHVIYLMTLKHNLSIAINEMLQMCREWHRLLLELNGNIS